MKVKIPLKEKVSDQTKASRFAVFKRRGKKIKIHLIKIVSQGSSLICLTLAWVSLVWVTSLDLSISSFGSPVYPENDIHDGEMFEYIVVGGGAAGGVAAARLAQAARGVLLLEAGGTPGLLTRLPGIGGGLIGSAADYSYPTQPNGRSCLSSIGRFCRFSRGRVLGGSTAINLMMYTRGHPADYDFGLPGWTWPEIRPFFLRSEGLQNSHQLPMSSASYHNTDGVVPVGFFGDSENPWQVRVLKGFNSLNFTSNPDLNAESQIGVSRVLSFTSGGERVNTAEAYLRLPGVSPHLRLATHSTCLRVLINDVGEAFGVEIARNDRTYRIFSQREVILAAGAIGSAEILLRSGVGPADHLRRLNIPVRADLSVGEGLIDHVAPLLFISINEKAKSSIEMILSKLKEGIRWVAMREGPLATSGLSDLTAFLNTQCYDFKTKQLRNDGNQCERPTVQYIHSYFERGFMGTGRSLYEQVTRHEAAFVHQLEAVNERHALLVVTAVVLQPKSRGHVRLASTHTFQAPLISPNYLEDERDVEEAVRAIRILDDLTQTPEYRNYNASILRPKLPGCTMLESTDYWRCYVRHMTVSVHHATGTVALGRVTDERGRVRQVRGLRVVDAGLFPRPPSANTAAAVIALSERITQFIQQDNISVSHYIDRK
ncbi:unnamed protein product [Pieris brassicae]|uniref:Glucose-methanol-choline oxidoreductase N-terminal domain-containing protein n=1 Tax=Pieris brassicae TaxID=7116 RepID=A0A9P0TG76_PIEBR|nr:unnamed protein product [Pieris brassicae]